MSASDQIPLSSSPEALMYHDSPELISPSAKRRRTSYMTGQKPIFKAGAVLRMRMQNFMTYDDISYDFGPALNMIIGPNGSGKSTVVAGICLGLGFDPKIMGRADKVEATIKHGTQSATIEITLQGQQVESVVTIKRQFGHSQNGGKSPNEWHINGKKTTQKAVQELVRGFNCQIDNLCQFLPQDKVASFARMKPVEMLAETLRTIGDGSLGVVHAELINLQTKLNSETTSRKTDEDKLIGLKARQEVLERDVARFREREAHKRAIYVRKMRLPFAQYNEAKNVYLEAKDRYNEVKAKLYELKNDNQPLEIQETALDDELLKAGANVTKLKQRLDAALRKVEATALPLKKAEAHMQSLESEYKQEREAERANKTKIRELQDRVAKGSRSLGPEPDVAEEMADLLQQIKDLNQGDRAEKAECDELEDFLTSQQNERQRLEAQLEIKDRELLSLDDIKSVRLAKLRQINPDAADAVTWLQNNRSEFENRVYDPVLLEIQVTNKKFAKAAQHVLMQNAFTFTCQSRKDYQTFNRLLVDGRAAGRRLRLNVAEYSKTSAPRLRDQRSPMTKEELQEFGFDGYLLDCLDGHEVVLNTLCHSAQIHSLPIGTRNLSPQEIQAIENATKNNRPVFQRYILNGTDTKIFRGYGQTSSESQSVYNDGAIFSHIVDLTRKKQLENEISEIREFLDKSVLDLRQKSDRHSELKVKLKETGDQKKGLLSKRASMQQRVTGWTAANTKLQSTRRELDRIEHAPAVYQDNMAAIRAKQLEQTKRLTITAMDYKDDIKTAHGLSEKHVIALSVQIQAKADKDLFDIHNRTLQAELRACEEQVRAGKEEKQNTLGIAQSIMKRAHAAVADLAEDEKDLICNYDPDITVEELELQIAEYQNHLGLLAETDGNVLDHYEARAKEIEVLEGLLVRKSAVLDKLRNDIETERHGFEDKLEGMRSSIDKNFGDAFHSIDCLGEIRISKPEDFAAWSLEIWVQFRDADSLQMLTGERQSGGERSVSTIFYLMALQSLSIAPFRVVDEINQGMDPRNERRVHARMVEVACEITTSQYFLITPKLLTDLEYHPNMKVHCVTSGNLGRSGNKIGNLKYLAALRERKTQTQLTQSVS